MLLATALLIIGLLLVVYSADRLVFAASILCRTLGVPPLIIGMTVVSIGTSLPEIITAVAASLHGQLDLAIGTAIGSNITNILLILGVAALLHPLPCIPISCVANCRSPLSPACWRASCCMMVRSHALTALFYCY